MALTHLHQRPSFWAPAAALLVAVAVAGFAATARATYSLPADRCVTWRGNVGVAGDIPARTVISASLAPSGGDDSDAIQSALDSCPAGQVVKLGAGTFTVSRPISVRSGSTLRGAGMGVTIIKGASRMTGSYLMGFNAGAFEDTAKPISSGFSKGSTRITTGSHHGWKPGDILLIDQMNDRSSPCPVTNVGTNGACIWCGRAGGTRALGQMVKVLETPTGTTATLEVPLAWNFDGKMSPQATRIGGITTSAGIEDLTADNSLSGSERQRNDGATLAFYGTSNCWLLHVEGIGSYVNMVRMKRSYRDTVRGSRFHEGVPALPATGSQYSTRRAYGIVMDFASAALIEDNEIYHLTMATLMRGPTSGNVVSYNFVTDMYYSKSPTWQTASFVFHGGHAMMNLFEGNYVAKGRICADVVWGSSSHNTFFRNRNSIDTDRPAAAWIYSLYRHSTYFNIIGNVIGSRGFEAQYILSEHRTDQKAVFWFDRESMATVLLHANWDSVSNGVRWNGSDDRTLPRSMYLDGKPSWWGSMQWPAIGPDVSPMYPAAPALGSGTPW